MPELPEVETIRRGLEARIVGKKIAQVEVRHPKIVRQSIDSFRRVLQGKKFIAIDRRGKLLILTLVPKKIYLLTHMKMTGQLIYHSATERIAGGHNWPPVETGLPNKFTHVTLTFSDGAKLYFNDMRQFGYWQIVDEAGLDQTLATYGPEPLALEFTYEVYRSRVKGRTVAIKAVLLNQQVIAGIGNIYADEICFAAGVRPSRPTNRITEAEHKKIYQAIKRILKTAIVHGGTTFRHYRDAGGKKGNYASLLKVYGHAGQKCSRCGQSTLKKVRVAGRGTVYCPVCQK